MSSTVSFYCVSQQAWSFALLSITTFSVFSISPKATANTQFLLCFPIWVTKIGQRVGVGNYIDKAVKGGEKGLQEDFVQVCYVSYVFMNTALLFIIFCPNPDIFIELHPWLMAFHASYSLFGAVWGVMKQEEGEMSWILSSYITDYLTSMERCYNSKFKCKESFIFLGCLT